MNGLIGMLKQEREKLITRLVAIDMILNQQPQNTFGGKEWMQDAEKVKAWKRHIAAGVRAAARKRRARAAAGEQKAAEV